MKEDEQDKNNAEINRNSVIAVVVCVLFLAAYLYFEKQQFIIDNNVLIFIFAGLGFLFIPVISRIVKRIKVSSFEVELNSVASRTLLGEVVQDNETAKFYYIARDRTIFTLPDMESADILKSYKGILKISKDKLKEYGILYKMESAKKANILRSKKGDVYIILNKRKYYVSSYSPIRDMGRIDNIRDVENEEELDKYETGR